MIGAQRHFLKKEIAHMPTRYFEIRTVAHFSGDLLLRWSNRFFDQSC